MLVATFDPHPVRFFKPDLPPFRLTTLDQRERLFAEAGADAMLVFQFGAELAEVDAADFVTDYLVSRIGAAGVVTGEDFTFGKGRGGNIEVLKLLGQANRLSVDAVAPVSDGDEPVSSSRIRDALQAGDCETAAHLLTRPFAIEGVVEHGDKRGPRARLSDRQHRARQISAPALRRLCGARPAAGRARARRRRQSRHPPDVRSAEGAARALVLRLRRRPLRPDCVEVSLHLLSPRRGERSRSLDALKAQIAATRRRGSLQPSPGLDPGSISLPAAAWMPDQSGMTSFHPPFPAKPPPMSEQPDYRSTVFLPKTDFPMKAGLAQKEPAILARWAEEKLYEQLREARAGRERFILHDGPPYANGDLHMGHAMNKILKDIVVRSQSLLGKDAPYIPGWDCHGLPIEWKVEEQYRKKKLDKDEVPTAQFRAECRAYAEKWVAMQSEQFQRLGVMGEWDDPYLTMKYEAEAKICEELLKFAESGQLYRGAKPVMWSPGREDRAGRGRGRI